jgi:transposase
MTHDYKRHGTTTLFAAYDILEGNVIGRCMQRHRHQEFIRFLNAVEREVPAGKTVHAILDNYATHKHPKVIEWLGRHPRWTFHFTPTSASWLNAVEGFFAILTRRRLKRGVFNGRRRSTGRHQPLRRRPQPAVKALRLDRRSRQNHRRRRARAPGAGVNPPTFGLGSAAVRAECHSPERGQLGSSTLATFSLVAKVLFCRAAEIGRKIVALIGSFATRHSPAIGP